MLNKILSLTGRARTACLLTALTSLIWLWPGATLHAQYRDTQALEVDTLHQRAREAMQQGNYAIAYCIWQPLAAAGDQRAQFNVGWMYHNGYGLRIDDETALFWWLRAASTGLVDAHYALGDLYANGQGVERNLPIAIGWYISAALKAHEGARETLITLLNSNNRLVLDTFNLLLKSDWSALGDAKEVAVDRANARSGPGTHFPVLATLERGHRLVPLREENGWTYVGITGIGKTAWIFSRLIDRPDGIYAAE